MNTHTLPALPYDFNALEPHIDARTMEIHYTKHHQGYCDKFNAALEQEPDLAQKSVEELLSNLEAIPEGIREAIRNNGGGYHNHILFWESMTDKKTQPSEEVRAKISDAFGNIDDFKEKFSQTAKTLFGSGWAWLVKNKDGALEIISTHNQDSPLSDGAQPLLCLDVWEHAYYLNYQNKRADYVDAWWNIVNWDTVQERLLKS